jgi:hypothetical protein
VLELAYRADSNSAAREGLWVRVPPAVPIPASTDLQCRAVPPDSLACVDEQGLGPAYGHLLGLYLGDGMLSEARRNVWRSRISLDAKYPGIIQRAKAAMKDVAQRAVGEVARPGCVEINAYWKHWICLFPQHGAGPKHKRPIRLSSWQANLVAHHPDAFVAGLIHSDGCRCVNKVRGHEYPRYFFSNLSADIRSLFVEACSLIGVDCRPDGPRNISVARRDSVAVLEHLVGPKR